MSLTVINDLFNLGLAPIPPFSWFELPICTFDIVGAVRLCVVLRQIQASMRASTAEDAEKGQKYSEASFVKDVTTTLTVVYGGEALGSIFLGFPPSFLVSPTYPLLFIMTHYVVGLLPEPPAMSLYNELPLAFLDAFTRTFLLTTLTPAPILNHSSPAVSNSPYSLLISSLMIANGGFFFVNMFSMLSPFGWSLSTPPEVQAYGWSTLDLWCAPLITGLYALLTHAQPAWAALHAALVGFTQTEKGPQVPAPYDHETARAICTVLLSVLFASRAGKNFGGAWWKREKKRVPRSKIDGKPYRGKVKVQ